MTATSGKLHSVIIVGAGISGLSAGYELVRRGATDFLLLSSDDRVGGVIANTHHAGFIFEHGPDSFLTAKPATLALCRDLGLADEVIGSNDAERRTWIWHRGRLAALPEGWQFLAPSRLWPALTTSLLSTAGKLRLAQEFFAAAEELPADESVAAFVRRRLGPEALATIVAPLLAGVYGGDPEELSLAAVLPRFVELARRGSLTRALWRARASHAATAPLFSTLRCGLTTLTTALMGQIGREHIELARRAVALEDLGGCYGLHCDDGQSRLARAVVLALPAAAAAQLTRTLDPSLAAELAAIPYASSVTVNLAFAQAPALPPGTGVLVPRGQGLRQLACTFVHRKFAHRAPPGAGLLRLFFGGRGDEAALTLSDAELLQMARNELGVMLGIHAEPAATSIARWPRAMAQYGVGHQERLRRIELALARHPGLALAGNAYGGIGIGDCIAAGQRAVQQASKQWEAQSA